MPPAPGDAAVVNWNCVSKAAVKVAGKVGAVTECEIAPPSDQLLKTKRVPPLPCGDVVEIVCELPGTQLMTCVVVKVVPSTVKLCPDGEVCTVTLTLAAKLAVMLTGPLMVTVVDALVALATGPVQFVKLKLAFGVA